jgi:hypothetical protein
MNNMDIKELKQIVDKLKSQTNFYSLSKIEMLHLITHLFEKDKRFTRKIDPPLSRK